jgi:hypothetical protein
MSDEAAPNVDNPLGVQYTVRESRPPKASPFTPILQKPTKPNIDKPLYPPKGLTGIGMPVVIRPSSDSLIYLFQELFLGYRGSPFCQVFDPMA